MPRRKKGAVHKGRGSMCNICGKNCGKGGALRMHIKKAHDVEYEIYNRCFYDIANNILFDKWDDSVSTHSGKTVITHAFVRRFVGSAGPRGVRK